MSEHSEICRELDLHEEGIAQRLKCVDFRPEDLARVRSVRDLVEPRAQELTEGFFSYLAALPEARALTQNREVLEKAKRLKEEHLRAMFQGDYSPVYAEQRVRLGKLYSQAGLEPRAFLGAYQNLVDRIGRLVTGRFAPSPSEGYEHFNSLRKVVYFDISLIVDVLVFERQRVIRQQQEAIRELSTPVLQIRDRLLLLPIIGVIDSHRAQLVTEGLLKAIRDNRASMAVMDVTGVATIDSKVANHLLQTVAAARLMGARVIVTGLSAEVAQSLVSLGIDLDRVTTMGDLQGGVEEAEKALGYRVLKPGAHSPEGVP